MPEETTSEDLQVATNATKRLYAFNLRREYLPQHGPAYRVLYHYTTVDGLKGIVEQNELWATSAYFLNDSAEIFYGIGVLSEVLKKWLDDSPLPQDSLHFGLVSQLHHHFVVQRLDRRVIEPIFLICFCEDDNLLSQWRAYGQSGGYSLGFNLPTQGGVAGVKPQFNPYTAKLVRVEYQRETQLARCRQLLDDLLALLDDPALPKALIAIIQNPQQGYGAIYAAFVEILSEEIMGFKNQAFDVEKEWRLVVRQRSLFRQVPNAVPSSPMPFCVRASHGMLVPYVKLVPAHDAATLPITCVRSGPTLDRLTAWLGIRVLLDNHGYPQTDVEGSDITVKL